jgi:hypothetical protein
MDIMKEDPLENARKAYMSAIQNALSALKQFETAQNGVL